jgi:hypothetical protein
VGMATTETRSMKSELKLLNLICVIIALGFLALIVLNALFSPQLLTTDNLFVTMVCLVMALMFGINPLLHLKSEGKLPIPFQKRLARRAEVAQVAASTTPPLLDAKGRAVPPDVRSMIANMKQKQPQKQP